MTRGGHIPTFAQYAPQAFKEMKKVYVRYTQHISSIEKGTELQKKITKFSDSDLIYSASGCPMVPAPIRNINGVETSLIQQQIIRSYLKAHYGA